jgi:hypothetical protein
MKTSRNTNRLNDKTDKRIRPPFDTSRTSFVSSLYEVRQLRILLVTAKHAVKQFRIPTEADTIEYKASLKNAESLSLV